jgi:hypothetical protein
MMTSDQIEGSPALNLDALERKVWMRYFEDGINDLYLGMLLLLMGAGLFAPEKDTLPTNHILLLATIGLLVCAGYFLAKRFITYPRIGMVKFGPRAKVRQKRATVLLSLSALVGLALFVIFMLSASGGLGITAPDILYPVAWSVNCLLVFGLTGYFYIGFLAFAVPATPIVVIGAVLLIRFIRNYPLPHEMSNVRSSR